MKLNFSARFSVHTAAVLSVFIILVAAVFTFSQRNFSGLFTSCVNYAEQQRLKAVASSISDMPGVSDSAGMRPLMQKLRDILSGDSRILNFIVYSKTADDSYFRAVDSADSSAVPGPELNSAIRDTDGQFRKGMLEITPDTTIFGKDGKYWNNTAMPVKIGGREHVLQLVTAAPPENPFSTEFNTKSRLYISIISIAAFISIITLYVMTWIFNRRFSIFIRGLSEHLSRAASGSLEVSMRNDAADEEIAGLASSFNRLMETLKSSGDAALPEAKSPDEMSGSQSYVDRLFADGVSFMKEQHFDRAIDVFSAVRALRVDSFGAYYNLGVAFARTGQFDKSLENFNEALALNPANRDLPEYIAKVERIIEKSALRSGS